MRHIIISLALICIFTFAATAAEEREIQVGRCKLNVVVMTNSQEHSRGLLGYTERTFPYDGMLFEMGRTGRKYFHTINMQMPIRIMGVMQSSADSDIYRVVGSVKKAPPGLDSIMIDAPDVLEIPEQRYLLRFKNCLNAPEEK